MKLKNYWKFINKMGLKDNVKMNPYNSFTKKDNIIIVWMFINKEDGSYSPYFATAQFLDMKFTSREFIEKQIRNQPADIQALLDKKHYNYTLSEPLLYSGDFR